LDESEGLLRLLGLKSVRRQGWTRHPIPVEALESVADHSYGTCLLAWLLCPPELDRAKVLELALLHDLAETVTGDLTPADGVPESLKKRGEREALSGLLRGWDRQEEGLQLQREYHEQQSLEARFVKAMDRLDMVLQSWRYERQYQLDLSEFRESARAVLEQAGLAEYAKG
jgi:putative hydrolase of HD superfamily